MGVRELFRNITMTDMPYLEDKGRIDMRLNP